MDWHRATRPGITDILPSPPRASHEVWDPTRLQRVSVDQVATAEIFLLPHMKLLV
jgi:hypothetical protein